jgi:hypothetical protein
MVKEELTVRNKGEIVVLMLNIRSEKGFAPLFLVFMLFAVIAGVLLVSQRTN